MATLTQGCVSQIYHDAKPRTPIVQLIELKAASSSDPSAAKRVKVKISDGEHWGVGMLTSGMAQQVLTEALRTNAFVKLKNYMVNQLQNSKICIIVDLEIVGEQDGEQIGDPVTWQEAVSAAPAVGTPGKGDAPASEGPGTTGTSRTASQFAGTPPQAPQGFRAPPANFTAAQLGRPMPIESLNPYSNRWTIKARVISKSELRTYNSPKMGEGKVFSMDICDDSGEMRVTLWREAAERYFELVNAGSVYLISKGQLRVANKKFCSLNCQYEMSLSYDSILQLCADEPASLPKIRYSLVPLAEIADKVTNSNVDVIGVVSDVSGAQKIVSKAGRELTKRTAKIADDSGMSIEITMWGGVAEQFPDDAEGKVVAFKGARVTEWNEKSLGAGPSFEVEPEHEATTRLQAWAVAGGAADTKSLSVNTRSDTSDRDSVRACLLDLQEAGVGTGEKPSYFNILATITKINPSTKSEQSIWYSSCPTCQRKVVGEDGSGFNCEKCGWAGEACVYRYMLPCVACDGGANQWLSAFNDMAEILIGKKAGELKAIKDADQHAYEAIIDGAQWKRYVMTLRGKVETYQDVSKLKVHIIRAAPVNYANEGKTLLADIAKYNLPAAEPMKVETKLEAVEASA
jgi:replication factor A1